MAASSIEPMRTVCCVPRDVNVTETFDVPQRVAVLSAVTDSVNDPAMRNASGSTVLSKFRVPETRAVLGSNAVSSSDRLRLAPAHVAVLEPDDVAGRRRARRIAIRVAELDLCRPAAESLLRGACCHQVQAHVDRDHGADERLFGRAQGVCRGLDGVCFRQYEGGRAAAAPTTVTAAVTAVTAAATAAAGRKERRHQ